MSSSNPLVGFSVEHFGRSRIITNADIPIETEADRHRLLAQIEAEQRAPVLDLDTLERKLALVLARSAGYIANSRGQTPSTPSSIDPGEQMESIFLEEERSRASLLQYGCPPCYPTDTKVAHASETCVAVPYYLSVFESNSAALYGQLWEWEQEFRPFQKKMRCSEHEFHEYICDSLGRRKTYGFQGDMDLDRILHQQTPLQNWIEYQTYHLREVAKQGRNTQQSRRREKLLQWIETERRAMDRSEQAILARVASKPSPSRHRTRGQQGLSSRMKPARGTRIYEGAAGRGHSGLFARTGWGAMHPKSG